MAKGGSGFLTAVQGKPVGVQEYKARFVVNSAGVASDKIAQMVDDFSFKVKPRFGEYLLLHKNQGHLSKHILFPAPDPVKGKGVLVQRTLWGNLILGPTARDLHDPNTLKETPASIVSYILHHCKTLIPNFDVKEVIHSFTGVRAKTDVGDWIIRASEKEPRLIHAAGIDSPGVAGSPAIAIEIVRLLEVAGLKIKPNLGFNPIRLPIIVPKDGNLKYSPVGQPPDPDPRRNVVCKCEKVTESEIIDACHRVLPIDSTQAIRKRTRAGMGHCQAKPDNYDCERRVAEIIARETGLPLAAVGRRPMPASSVLPSRWPTQQQREELEVLSHNA